jgi:hypothetical protein
LAKIPLKPAKSNQGRFLIILFDFRGIYAKTVSLRSMMNGVGVKKDRCPKPNQK